MSEQWFTPHYFTWDELVERSKLDFGDGRIIDSADILAYYANEAVLAGNHFIQGIADAIGTGTRFVEDVLAGQPRPEGAHVIKLVEFLEITYSTLNTKGAPQKPGKTWSDPLTYTGWAEGLEPLESNVPRTPDTENQFPEEPPCAIQF